LNRIAFVEALSLKSRELLELTLHAAGRTPSGCEVAEEVQSGRSMRSGSGRQSRGLGGSWFRDVDASDVLLKLLLGAFEVVDEVIVAALGIAVPEAPVHEPRI
jgi:hypothetical protein